MLMNLLRTLLLLSSLALATAGVAQEGETAAANAELRQARALLKFGREDIVREDMRLSEKEATAFWPLYDQYEADLLQVRNRYAELLTGYTAAYRAGTVSAEQAVQVVRQYLDIQKEQLKIKQQYFDRFLAVLPPRKAARFYQLENKMEVEMEYQLAQIIPLVDPV